MNDNDDQMNPKNQQETEPQITAAFGDLRSKAESVPLGDIPGTGSAPSAILRKSPAAKWVAGGALAVAASIAVIAGVLAVRSEDSELTVNTDTNTASPTDSQPNTDTTVTTVSGFGQDPDGPLVVEEDGYYPWVSPAPYLSSFEEGCPTAAETARNFLGQMGWKGDFPVTAVDESSMSAEFTAAAPTEGGEVRNTLTHLELRRIELSFVDCEAWAVVSATSPDDIVIETPHPNTGFAGSHVVTGTGRGFEANIGLEAFDSTFNTLGQGYATAGWEMTEFEGVLLPEILPVDSNMVIVATSSGAIGNGDPFAAVKVRFASDLVGTPGSNVGSGLDDGSLAIDALVVIGVANDDVLNVRSGPGVENDVVYVAGPHSVGELGLVGGSQEVGSESWVEVRVQASGETGWVNSRFVSEVEGTQMSLAFFTELMEVREALQLNATADRLADIIASQTPSSVMVSTDGFLDVSETVETVTEADEFSANYGESLDNLSGWPAIQDTQRVVIESNGPLTFVELLPGTSAPIASGVQLVFAGGEGEFRLSGIAYDDAS